MDVPFEVCEPSVQLFHFFYKVVLASLDHHQYLLPDLALEVVHPIQSGHKLNMILPANPFHYVHPIYQSLN